MQATRLMPGSKTQDGDQPSQKTRSKRPRKLVHSRKQFHADTDVEWEQQSDSEAENGDQPKRRKTSNRSKGNTGKGNLCHPHTWEHCSLSPFPFT